MDSSTDRSTENLDITMDDSNPSSQLVSTVDSGHFLARMIGSMTLANQALPTDEMWSACFRNIHTYRLDIRLSLARANMTFGSFTQLLTAMAWVKNRQMLIQGFLRQRQSGRHHPRLNDDILSYLQNHTCATTRQQRPGVVCTLKIPDSFPELTALAFIRSSRTMSAELLVSRPWMASIDLAGDAREKNREACLSQWLKVHRVSRLRPECMGRFNEVYRTSSRDKIQLIDMQGVEFGEEVRMGDLEEYIRMVKSW